MTTGGEQADKIDPASFLWIGYLVPIGTGSGTVAGYGTSLATECDGFASATHFGTTPMLQPCPHFATGIILDEWGRLHALCDSHLGWHQHAINAPAPADLAPIIADDHDTYHRLVAAFRDWTYNDDPSPEHTELVLAELDHRAYYTAATDYGVQITNPTSNPFRDDHTRFIAPRWVTAENERHAAR